MIKSLRIASLIVAGCTLAMASAMALPSALELGSVAPGSPADESAETARLVVLVNAYNAGQTGTVAPGYIVTPTAGLPAAPNLPSVGVNQGHAGGSGNQDNIQVDLGTGGYNYIMVKWGNTAEYYYIGGLTGTVVVNNDVNGNGESHYDLFNGGTVSVPDGGATATLLGMSLSGLCWIGRRKKNS